MQHPSINLHYG